jgi:phosphatidate cytidylyltransferase
MKELLRRLLTGVVYVALLLSTVFLSSDAFDFLFMIFGLACIYEYKRMLKVSGYHIFLAYLILWWAYIYLITPALKGYPWWIGALLFTTLATDLALLYYLFSKKKKVFNRLTQFLIGVFYIGGGCIFLTMIPYRPSGEFASFLIMGIFILIWVNDSFAYLVGKSIGRTKLFPSVSPKKTIEGSLGGLVFSLLAGYFLARYYTPLSTTQWLILTVVVVISGSLGDLVESKFKRDAGVKDSGAILPGHGGMLDRLDSLIFAAPFAYFTLNLFDYVP